MPLAAFADVVDKTFDYVVVGGGSAGLLLAARLSEDPSTTVLVLEAGKPNLDDPLITRPAQFGFTLTNPDYDWGFKTVPQTNLNGREFMWHRGKGLGGSSAINFSNWNQPYKGDIDDWERLGNPGWNWAKFDKYSRQVATFYPNETLSRSMSESGDRPKVWDAAWGSGPLKLSHPKVAAEVELKFEETLVNMGIPWAPGPLVGETSGVYHGANHLDPETNLRSYSASAFLTPNAGRANLVVLTGAAVHRLVTNSDSDSDSLTATGVEFSHTTAEGEVRRVSVRKEVILCAGALKSPQILELSGIGRRDVLEKIGVKMKVALDGVGENMQDHMLLALSYELKADYAGDTFDMLRDPAQMAKHLELFKENKGIYMMGMTTVSFTSLTNVSPRAIELLEDERKRIEAEKDTYPPGRLEQYEMMLDKIRDGSPGFEMLALSAFMSGPNPPENGKKYVTIGPGTMYGFTRGTVHAKTSNPLDDPEIDPRYLEHDFDLRVFIDLVKFVRKAVKTAPLSECVADSPTAEVNPGLAVQNDADIAEWIKNSIGPNLHTCGTLSMLPKAKGGVVNPELKVYGTTNIRVADLSIAPMHFSGHSVAAAYTIGEIAAAHIRGTA